MAKFRPLIVMAICVLVGLPAGAESWRQLRKQGTASMQRGNYYAAVELFEKAMGLKQSKKTQKLLLQARSKAGQRAAAEAGEYLTSIGATDPDGITSVAQLSSLESKIGKIRRYDPKNAKLGKFEKFREQAAVVLKKRQSALLEKCKQQAASSEWNAALDTKRELGGIDRSASAYSACENDIESSAQAVFEEKLRKADGAGDLRSARAVCKQAAGIVKNPVWRARQERISAALEAESERSSRQIEKAFRTIQAARSSDLKTIQRLRDEISNEYREERYQQGIDLIRKPGQYWKAIDRLKSAADLGHAGAKEMLSKERTKAATRLSGRLEKLEAQKRYGQGLYEMQAYARGFGDKGRFGAEIRRFGAVVKERWPRAAQVEIDVSSVDPKYRSGVKAALMRGVQNGLSPLAMDDKGLLVTVKAGSFSINRRESTSDESVQYVAYYNTRRNPDWDAWYQREQQRQREAANKDVNKRLLASALGAAFDPEPEKTLKDPVYQDYMYKVRHVDVDASVAGECQVVLRLFDGGKVSISYTSDMVSESKSDKAHHGFSKADLAEDPLSLPTDNELLRKITGQLAERIVPTRSAIDEKIRAELRSKAEELAMSGEKERAVEYIMVLVANDAADEKLIGWLRANG